MGNESDVHNIHQKRSFLPMLCSKSSLKDIMDVVHPTRWDQHSSSSSSSSSSFSGDPLSPRVGCMGQVKKNNRVNGLPSISHNKLVMTSRKDNCNSNVKYLKLKKLFSGKNLGGNITPASTKGSGSNHNKRIPVKDTCRQKVKSGGNCVDEAEVISVVDMDPPLPVIKKEAKVGNSDQECENLWKRRCRGAAGIKTLELQQLQLSTHSNQLPTTV